ncbi:MAG TPA: hypothetical protein VGD56_08750, partial [Gemmatirosa sp.]
VAWGQAALPHVAAPTLVIASRQDNRIASDTVAAVTARLGRAVPGTDRPDLVWLDRCGHVIAADRERDTVAQHTAAWLDRHVPAEPSAASTPHRHSRQPDDHQQIADV